MSAVAGSNIQLTEFEDNSHCAEALEEASDKLSEAATALLEDEVEEAKQLLDESLTALKSVTAHLNLNPDDVETDE